MTLSMSYEDFHRGMFATTPCSSEEERDDRIRRRRDEETVPKTPWSSKRTSASVTTPMTAMVTPMTPSPIHTPDRKSFKDVQQGYLDKKDRDLDSKILFRDTSPNLTSPNRRHRKSRSSSRRSRLSQSLLLDDPPMFSFGMNRRTSKETSSSSSRSSPDTSTSSDSDVSPTRGDPTKQQRGGIKWLLAWTFLGLVVLSSAGTVWLTPSGAKRYEPTRPEVPSSAAGLRGKMVQGHWEDTSKRKDFSTPKKKDTDSKPHKHNKQKKKTGKKTELKSPTKHITLPMHLPPPISKSKRKFDSQDPALYSSHSSHHRRVVALDPSVEATHRKIKHYPADFTDNTQLYSILESTDERLSHMEMKKPYVDEECVPMQDWQTTFYPSCNGMHELAIETMGEDNGNSVNLFGTKGYWRNAWRVDVQAKDTIVLKTLKYEHNFEDAHFEHDRVDAVAMERLTSSPHVINVFGFCGHSVLSEYADVSRVGELADKAKKKPLARLQIARDIANGLADVHGINGDGNATFVHLDINPANVVSVGGTLKLNDFNIGIIRRWNVTSHKPCGFPAQYPNPQWRSPEEARDEQTLTEKVDVFSMGHIFFRLVCGHEPWNKLETGGKPSKDEINKKVQKGVLPFIPDHVRNSENPEVIAIRDAMLACYTFDPLERPSARDIVKSLETALESLTKTTTATNTKS